MIARIDVTGPWTPAWAEAFVARVAGLRDEPGLRAVLLASDGPAFGYGGDVAVMQGDDVRTTIEALARRCHEGFLGLVQLPVPVIARVHGVAAGMAFSLVLAADVVVAGRGASFTTAYAGIGASPDGGMSWTLPRIVGRRRAAELLLTARRIDAGEALALGLVTELADDLDAAVDAWTTRLAAGPTAAYGQAKRLLEAGATCGLAEQLDDEARTIAALLDGPTGREGVAAFLAGRRPDFTATTTLDQGPLA